MSGRRREIRVNGKSLLLAVIVLALCTAPAFFLNTLFGYFPLLFLICVLVLSFLHGYLLSGKISTNGQEESFTCTRNEDLILRQFFENRSLLPASGCTAFFVTTDLNGEPRSQSSAVFTLGPRERREMRFRVVFDHVGEYSFYMKELRIDGFFGILSFVLPARGRMTVEVLPKIHRMDAVDFSGNVRTESADARFRSSAESVDVSGVREYEIGDPIKMIHWKLSSHSGSYVTKLLESYGNNALTILPVMEKEKDAERMMNLYDAVLECSVSLEARASEEGIETVFYIEDSHGENRYVNETDAAALLSEVKPRDDAAANLEMRLTEEAGRRYGSDNVAVCTSVLDSRTADAVARLAQSGRRVLLFYIKDGQEEQSREEAKMIRTLSYFGVNCWTIGSAEDIGRVVSR